jgi:hypothetical protein
MSGQGKMQTGKGQQFKYTTSSNANDDGFEVVTEVTDAKSVSAPPSKESNPAKKMSYLEVLLSSKSHKNGIEESSESSGLSK